MTTPPLPPALASRLAHEIRSPLGVLSGTLAQLSRDEGLTPTSAQLLELARRSCVRMERLSRRLGYLAADGPTVRGPMQMSVLRGWVERASTETGRKSIEVKIGPLPELTLPGRTAAALEVALDEVVHNATRHAQTRVDVRTRQTEVALTVLVSDDGRGLPAELVGTTPPTTTDSHSGGLGLGLLVAHRFLGEVDGALNLHADRVEIEVPVR